MGRDIKHSSEKTHLFHQVKYQSMADFLGMNDLDLAALLTLILTTDLLEYKAIKQEVKFPAPPFR